MTEHPQPVRIFLAEDHLPDVILIKEALRHAKITYDLEHVEDGEQAIRALLERDTANRPQLIIVDINLPKKTGFEVIQALRDSGKLGNVPVMVLTSSKSGQDRQRAFELGIAAFVSKPPDLHEFLADVGDAIARILSSRMTARGCHRHRAARMCAHIRRSIFLPWRTPRNRPARISR